MTVLLTHTREITAGQRARGAALVLMVVLLASLFGILTRPIGFLAAVWPANAILLAMMVRNPSLSSPAGWSAAFIGYVAADLLTGGGLLITMWLTAANMAGAMAGYALFMGLSESDRRLDRPHSIINMFMICTIAAAVAALVGGGAAHLLFDRDFFAGFVFWFSTELVNAIIVLPVILAAPRLAALAPVPLLASLRSLNWIPLATLVLSMAGGLIIGGPGAFAYPIPALLWCALTYGVFGTAVLTLLFSVVQLVAISMELLPLPVEGDQLLMTVSIRLAIALIALGPLAVANINAVRDALMYQLQHAADHDSLTGVLTRGAFMQRAAAKLDDERQGEVAALMIDVDHFKSVNDRHGHAVGDEVLVKTAEAITGALRQHELMGRLGGEEFAIVLGVDEARACIMAERIRAAVEDLAIVTSSGQLLRVTVSIGVASTCSGAHACLHGLLASADKALYAAKTGGRNRVSVTAPAMPATVQQGRSAA